MTHEPPAPPGDDQLPVDPPPPAPARRRHLGRILGAAAGAGGVAFGVAALLFPRTGDEPPRR